jgi:hypothetical protein
MAPEYTIRLADALTLAIEVLRQRGYKDEPDILEQLLNQKVDNEHGTLVDECETVMWG